jgi:hypothetical protein
MTTKLQTMPLQTKEMTLMSNNTSIKVIGHKISKLIDQDEKQQNVSSSIHLTFDVKKEEKSPCILNNPEELGFIINPKDAIEIGLSLIAMGMDFHNEITLEEIKGRLAQISAEIES